MTDTVHPTVRRRGRPPKAGVAAPQSAVLSVPPLPSSLPAADAVFVAPTLSVQQPQPLQPSQPEAMSEGVREERSLPPVAVPSPKIAEASSVSPETTTAGAPVAVFSAQQPDNRGGQGFRDQGGARDGRGFGPRSAGFSNRPNGQGGNFRRPAPAASASTPLSLQPITGFLDLTQEGHAVVRRSFSQGRQDAYLGIALVRRLGLRPGDVIEGTAREPRDNDRWWGMQDITAVNGQPVENLHRRSRFEDLTPVYPNEKLVLETGPEPVGNRLIDLVAPIGKGQRGLVVSPPKAGKTTIMKDIATGIAANFPDVHVMAVLIGERPEEVTDIRRHIEVITKGKGEVAASNFDEPALEQTRVAEVALERAKRLVEAGRDVVIVLDSITRLARAYNLAIPTSGRTLSGGFDPAALYPPKRFFGAARNFEVGGSLTIIGTALVDTGSRMDDLVYEEFKGTGNMELHLDRALAERRIFPAINVRRSGTRRDDLLFSSQEYQAVVMLHRMMDMLNDDERSEVVIRRLRETDTNKQFLASLKG